MTSIRDGFMVEELPGSPVRRVARMIPRAPEEGTVHPDRVVRLGGRAYRVAFHFPPGIRQGRAVAWVISK